MPQPKTSPTSRPKVILSCTMSLDGYLDDTSNQRLLLSDDKDFDRVDELRASCDAILVGAETIRKDNPRLIIRSEQRRTERVSKGKEPDPIKVTLTRSGRLNSQSNFFQVGQAKKYVYFPSTLSPSLMSDLNAALNLPENSPPYSQNNVKVHWMKCPDSSHSIDFLLHSLTHCQPAVNSLLVEGGSSIIQQFLTHTFQGMPCVDEMHLSIAPFFVGEPNAPTCFAMGQYLNDRLNPLSLSSVNKTNDIAVLIYKT